MNKTEYCVLSEDFPFYDFDKSDRRYNLKSNVAYSIEKTDEIRVQIRNHTNPSKCSAFLDNEDIILINKIDNLEYFL